MEMTLVIKSDSVDRFWHVRGLFISPGRGEAVGVGIFKIGPSVPEISAKNSESAMMKR
jgi:hypothetical protein